MVAPLPAPPAVYGTKYGVAACCALLCTGILLRIRHVSAVGGPGQGAAGPRHIRQCTRRLAVHNALLLAWGALSSLCGAVVFQHPRATLGGSPSSNRTLINLAMYAGVLLSSVACGCAALWMSLRRVPLPLALRVGAAAVVGTGTQDPTDPSAAGEASPLVSAHTPGATGVWSVLAVAVRAGLARPRVSWPYGDQVLVAQVCHLRVCLIPCPTMHAKAPHQMRLHCGL